MQFADGIRANKVPSIVEKKRKKKQKKPRVANELLVTRAIRERALSRGFCEGNRKLGPSSTRAMLVASLLSALIERYFPHGRD